MQDWVNTAKIYAGFDWLLPPLIPAVMLWSLVYRSGGPHPAAVYQTFELYIPIVSAFLFGGIAATGYQGGMGELEASYPASALRRLFRVFLLALVCQAAVLAVLCGIGLWIMPAARWSEMLRVAALPSLFLGVVALAGSVFSRSGLVGVGAALLYWGIDASTNFDFLPALHLFRNAHPMANQPGVSWLIVAAGGLLAAAVVLIQRRAWWV